MNRIPSIFLGVLAVAVTFSTAARADEPAPAPVVADSGSSATRVVSLDGPWQLTYGSLKSLDDLKLDPTQPPADFQTIPATVPGNVELDMLAQHLISDPYMGSNVYDLLKFEPYQWWYKCSFPTPQLAANEKAELVFDGLDCCGTVWLNGTLIGRPANMLIPHRFDVTSLLRSGSDNEVTVRIDPAVLVGRATAKEPGNFAYPALWEQLGVRKAPVAYGWDISPRLLSAGLWRDVKIEITPPSHINTIYWATRSVDVPHKTADLMFDWDISAERLDLVAEPLTIHATLARNGHVVVDRSFSALGTHGQESVNVKNADFWWPHGYGDPALYDATVDLVDEKGTVLDERKERIGLRTVKLHYVDLNLPANAGDMSFSVNGVKVFMRGVNWGALDGFHSKDAARLDTLLPLLGGLNCNFIRLYGVNPYPSARLYDYCDANGILVWQEFTMGNQRCLQNDAFYKVMDEEASAVIPQFRNHPSLAIWCGGNEFDGDYYIRDGIDPNIFDQVSRGVFPRAVERLDPLRDYTPCCWYLDPVAAARGVPVDKWVPEDHLYLWDAPWYFKAPKYTSKVQSHFTTEIGWKSVSSRASLEQMLSADAVQNPWVNGDPYHWKPDWITKGPQPFPSRPEGAERLNLLNHQLNSVFTEIPKNIDDYIVASQAAQAEATKFFLDSFRIRKGDPNAATKAREIWGVVLFQFQDGWPLIGFSIVDYYNRKKLAYDYFQESSRDVQAICGEAEEGRHPLVVVNDTLAPQRGHLTVTRLNPTGAGHTLLDEDFTVAANGKVKVGSIAHPAQPEMWSLDWKLEDGREFKGHYLATDKTVPLEQYRGWMKQLGIRTP